MTYRLDRDDPRLHLSLASDWFQRGTPETGIPNLRLALPLALTGTTASYEIPFGAVDRVTPPDQEVPALRWAKIAGDIGQSRAALLVVNDCKYGHACTGSTLRINLIRSSYDPDPLPEIGHHAMSFSLEPVAADLSTADATRRAQAFAAPLLPVATGVHAGRLSPTTALLELQGRDVVLSGIKFAESGPGLIVRVYETAGAAAKAAVAFDTRLAAPVEAKGVDLVERPLKEARPTLTPRAVKFAVAPFALASVWIKVKRAKA